MEHRSPPTIVRNLERARFHMLTDSPIHLLADRAGIVSRYTDQTGDETRATADDTRVAILAAMGLDASSPQAARAALETLEAREWARVLPPVRVVRRDDPSALQIPLHAPAEIGLADWSLEVTTEEGESFERSGRSQPQWDGSLSLGLRGPLPLGYHTVRVSITSGGVERSGLQTLVVVPDACPGVRDVAGRDRAFGLIANLYSVRSARNWGVGDFTDLTRLLEWTGSVGGSFVGVNPLHALRNRGSEVSPYSPVSRIFRNALYLDVTSVPELRDSPETLRRMASEQVKVEREALRASPRVEYERVIGLKLELLRALHLEFVSRHSHEETDRGRAYCDFVDAQGEPLRRFATFEALAHHLGNGSWREWPVDFRGPDTTSVRDFQRSHPSAVDFHAWMQFELDRQLGMAAAKGRDAGLEIGLYQDLAIGTSPDGADIWANPGLFLDGVSIGAPPDDYSASGQNWGLPPLNPRALRDEGYQYWIGLVRASMRHAGALRIDHVMGLFRQFWIPAGMRGDAGAYVRFPAEDLLGILALEAHRHRAIVVGEDLGTVPPEVPPALRRWGVLSSRVLYFEREGDDFRPASSYEPVALATANTHDMPTLAGFWAGRDIDLRREVGMIASEGEEREARQARDQERRALLRTLAAEGLLGATTEPESQAELRGAVHAFLCRTPSALVGLNLDDVVGEAEPVNLPGVPPDRFSSWTRKLSTPIEALDQDPDVRAAVRCEGRAR